MANSKKNTAKQVISYRYGDKRKNNPHVGMVDTISDGVEGHTTWAYDPHIDPTLNFDSARSGIEHPKGVKAELNEDLLARFQGTKSLPFEPGDNRRIAVKIVDDRGIESLKVMDIND